MDHPLQPQEEEASLFASPFSPMEQQQQQQQQHYQCSPMPNNNTATYTQQTTFGDQQQQQMTSRQMSQQQHHQPQHTRTATHPQSSIFLQHANSMPYPVNNNNTTNYNNNNGGVNNTAPPIIGPRGKCDQVIYEAMTKACEIVIRGRCTQLDLNERRLMFQQQQQQQQGGVNTRGYSDGMIPSMSNNTAANSNSSSSRFNIQVDEVPSVRSILQTWKRALNIPLRLDIFYEYTDDTNSGGGVQRELLERWCIDYKNVNMPSTVSSSSSKVMTGATKSSSSSSSMNNNINSSVSQLRLVCKRIVVLLRNLHCMTRMLPAYRLQSLIDNGGINGGDNGGILGIIHNNINNGSTGMGIIGFTIYASDYEPNGPTLPSPSFTQQSFPSVKTPYGNLGVSVMYDATLNPYQMVEDVVDRLRCEEEEEDALWNEQQQQQQQQWEEGVEEGRQQFVAADYNATLRSMPIPVPPETISTPCQRQTLLAQQQGRGGDVRREFGSCPPTLLRGRSRSSSLGGVVGATTGRTRAVSDLIITDYHSSPAMKPKASPSIGSRAGGNEKRIMSGLSLAMMADENSQQQQQQHYPTSAGGMPLSPDEYSEQDDSVMQHPWGSLATRAAFHHPPPTYESPGVTDNTDAAGGVTNNFFQYHGGYGYGYNGSQVQLNSEEIQSPFPPVGSAGSRANDGLSMSPSPLMSTPPPHYSSWMKRRQSSAAETNTPSSLKENLGDTQNSDQVEDDDDAPPFTNPTTLQALPASGTLSAMPASPSTHANRQLEQASSSVGNSPQHHELRNESYKRQSSSSVLLPPVTSLDLLQKSPFTAGGGGAGTGGDEDNLAMPFTLGSYRDEMFMSSIPKLVAAGSKSRTSSFAASTSGANPFTASFGQSSAGGYYSTGPFASRREIHGFSQSEATDEVEEMPFALALDEDSPFAKSSSRSLSGSTRGDLASSSLAVSSLHQRCDQGKPRLKMFSSSRTRSSGIRNDEDQKSDKDSTAADYSSIKDQLSEFRTWHSASLMVDSASK